MSHDWIDGDLPQFVARPSNAGPLIIDLDRISPYLVNHFSGSLCGFIRGNGILRKPAKQITGLDNRVRDLYQMDWLVCWNGKSFDAAHSNEAADENAVATFAYRITLNVSGLQGNQDDK